MRKFLNRKFNISRNNLIVCLLIAGIFSICAIALAHQSHYKPVNKVDRISSARSQVYIAGKGYKLDKKQLSDHEKMEKTREKLLKKKPQKDRDKKKENKIEKNNGHKKPSKTDKKGGNGSRQGNGDRNSGSGKKNIDPKAPVIQTSINDGMIFRGEKFAFWVQALDYGETPISAVDIEVCVNSKEVISVGRTRLGYNYLALLKKGENVITVKATDDEGRVAKLTKTVWRVSSKPKRRYNAIIRISAETIGNNNILNREIKIYSKESIASALTRCMKEAGMRWDNTGTVDRGFYLARIYKSGIAAGGKIHPKILEYYGKKSGSDGKHSDGENPGNKPEEPETKYPWTSSGHYNDSLGQFDFTKESGWVAYLDGVSIRQGFSAIGLEDGSVLWLRFTVNRGSELVVGDKNGWW